MATGKKLDGREPLAYMGVDPVSPPGIFINKRRPVETDYRGFDLGALWIIEELDEIWFLIGLQGNVATWVQIYPQSAGGASDFPCDVGTATESGGNLNVLGSLNIGTDGSGNTASISLTDTLNINSFKAGGFIKAALNITGDDGLSTGDLHVTGDNYLRSVGQGVLTTDSTGEITGSNGNADGKILIAADGGTPQWKLVTSADSSVTITNGPNSIDLKVAGGGGGGGGTGGDGFLVTGSSAVSPYYFFTDTTSDELGSMEALTIIFDKSGAFYAGSGAGHGQPGASYTIPKDGVYCFHTFVTSTYCSEPHPYIRIFTSSTGYYSACSDNNYPVSNYTMANDILLQLTMGEVVKWDFGSLAPFSVTASILTTAYNNSLPYPPYSCYYFFISGYRVFET